MSRPIQLADSHSPNKRIFDMWLACYEQKDIADSTGIDAGDLSKMVKGFLEIGNLAKSQVSDAEHATDFTRPKWIEAKINLRKICLQFVFYPYAGIAIMPTLIHQARKLRMNPAPKQPDKSTYSGRFAARLRQLREKAGLSVEDVVEAMGKEGCELPARTLYRWETADREPPIDALPALACALKLKSPRNLWPEK